MKLIVEMEMPTVCDECPMCDNVYYGDDVRKSFCIVFDERKEILTEDRPAWCPIKGVLPDEHGDLVDRDVALDYINRLICNGCNAETKEDCEACIKKGIDEVLYFVKPTIAAERKD